MDDDRGRPARDRDGARPVRSTPPDSGDGANDPASVSARSVPDPTEAWPAIADRLPGPSEPPLVIVADDDHSVRAVFRLALERAGFNVLTASNGRRALELA